MRRVLVTGATGGLGRNAVEILRSRGIQVRATGRRADVLQAMAAQGVETVRCDLAHWQSGNNAVTQALLRDVDTVWHCAALSSPWGRARDFELANVQSTRHLLDAAGRAGVSHFVHVSTPALYFDYVPRHDVREDYVPRRYVNHYARTKALAEQEVQAAVAAFPTMHCTILRPRAIFGPYDQVLIPRIAQLLVARRGRLPLPDGGRARMDITYVDNVVQAMMLASGAGPWHSGDVFNITNHEPVVLVEVLEHLFVQLLDQRFEVQPVPAGLMRALAHLMQGVSLLTRREPRLTPYSVGALHVDMTLDNTRAREILGYVPLISVEEGIRRTANWMLDHG